MQSPRTSWPSWSNFFYFNSASGPPLSTERIQRLQRQSMQIPLLLISSPQMMHRQYTKLDVDPKLDSGPLRNRSPVSRSRVN